MDSLKTSACFAIAVGAAQVSTAVSSRVQKNCMRRSIYESSFIINPYGMDVLQALWRNGIVVLTKEPLLVDEEMLAEKGKE